MILWLLGIYPVIVGRMTFCVNSGHTFSASKGCWTIYVKLVFFSANVLPGKCGFYLWVYELQTFQSKQFYKIKTLNFNKFETMAANINRLETSAVIRFKDMNCS